jgi:hypothetical protein
MVTHKRTSVIAALATVAVLMIGGYGADQRAVAQAVHGPADLGWSEAAEIVSAATGKPLWVERITDDAMHELLREAGMADGLADAVIGHVCGLREGFVPEQLRTVRTTTPTTLVAWAYETLRPEL